jgi:hypothetical protein
LIIRQGGGEGFDLGDRRREAGEIEGEAADEGGGIGGGLEAELAAGETGGDEGVDGIGRELRAES